jgi:hypothetical protein
MIDGCQEIAKCWICGEPANSAEHRIKKADLVRAYGAGPYQGPSAPLHVRVGVSTPIRGPRSTAVKYEKSLCQECNTARTQPYDRTYDQFISWILEKECIVLRKRFLNFAEIYNAGFEERQRNLFKYFVKSFGCRLVDGGEAVPQDLIALLPQHQFRTALKITFSVNEDTLLLPKSDRDGFIGKSDLINHGSKANPATGNGYTWSEHVSWLTVLYWYMVDPEGGLGTTWIANVQYLYLGSAAPLTPEQREEFLSKN